MAINTKKAPPDELRNRIEYRDGKLFWRDMPENKHALARSNGTYIGAGTDKKGSNYARLRFEGDRYAVHRVVYWLFTGDWPEVVDHINRDKHDNRIENLRASDQQLNRLNSETNYSINAVRRANGELRYYPSIMINGRTFRIGIYNDELTALYAAWKIRDILYPGIVPFPSKLAEKICSNGGANTP